MPQHALATGTLWYTDTTTAHGPADGPGQPVTVMATHGFLVDGRIFEHQQSAFPGVRWISWDSRSHGGSSDHGPAQHFSYWDQARDALSLMDALGVERAVFLGQAQGGFIAQRMALIAPHRCLGLAMISTSGEQYTDRERIGYEAVFSQWLSSAAQRTAKAPLVASSIIAGDREKHQLPWVRRWLAREDWSGFDLAVYCLINHDRVLDELARTQVPALVVRGSEDQAFLAEHHERLAAALGVAPITVDGGSHNLPFTHPDELNPILGRWLTEIAEGPAPG